MTCKEQILSEDYRDFIVSDLQQTEFTSLFPNITCRQNMGTFYEAIYIEKELASPIGFSRYPYNSIPKCFTLLDMNAMQQAGILQVQNYPTLELQGSGVLIGFVDTGLNYDNTIFKNLDGSTRVAGIWDQTDQRGEPPEGFLFGTEFTEEQLNSPSELVPLQDDIGHGTFLASLAAGGPNEEEQFIGAAPDCRIGVVKLKQAKRYLKEFYQIYTDAPCYQENDIMLGVTYLNQLAEQLNLPLVLCIALGTNQGGHSAGLPLVSQLDVYGNVANRAIVVGAGNEANQRHHFLGIAENINDIKEVEIRVDENTNGLYMECWSDVLDIFEVEVESPSGERTYTFPIRGGISNSYTFILERTTLTLDYKVFIERLNAELIAFRFESITPGIWKIIVKPIQIESGVFHMWLPVTEFMQGDTFFLESNPDFTITEPSSALSGITVGFYNGNDNSVAIQSGRGYTRGMRIKPEFVSPGVDVKGLGMRELYSVRSGSSIAAGITAGAAALIMEWVVYRLEQSAIDSTEIRNLLILGTEKRPQETYPNREWGYGKLNVYNTFETLRRI